MLHNSLTVCVSFSVRMYVCVCLHCRPCKRVFALCVAMFINILDMIIVLLSAIYVIYIAQIVCFLLRIHVGLLQRVGFKAVYLIVQPAIQRLYNAPNALKLYMHPVIWALWGHAEAEIMHQYCNIHSPPLDAHVLINPPTSALGFPNNGHIFTNHYLGLATSSLQFTLPSKN